MNSTQVNVTIASTDEKVVVNITKIGYLRLVKLIQRAGADEKNEAQGGLKLVEDVLHATATVDGKPLPDDFVEGLDEESFQALQSAAWKLNNLDKKEGGSKNSRPPTN